MNSSTSRHFTNASCRPFIRCFVSSASEMADTTVGDSMVPLQWMKYCPECLNKDKRKSEKGKPNVHYTLWKRVLGEARSLLDSSKMLEEDKLPNRRIFDICDLLYAFAQCSTGNIPKRKRDELVRTGIPSRLMSYFVDDPERFNELTIVQLGRLVWTMATLGQLSKAEPAKVITDVLRKEDRYKQLTGLNLVRVVQAFKGVSETQPGRRHLGDRLMGQVLKQRKPLLKMELFVEGLRAAGQLTVINSVTQHKLVDLFLKEIIPKSGPTVMLSIPACLDSIKLTDDVVFEEWVTRFLSCLTESSSESILKDANNKEDISAALISLAHLQVGPPGLTSSALGILLNRMAGYIREGGGAHHGVLSARALTTIIRAFGNLATESVQNTSIDSMKSLTKKELRESSTKVSEVLTLCLTALDFANSPSDRLLQLASAVNEINTSDVPLLRGVSVARKQVDRLESGFDKVLLENIYTIDELIELLKVVHSLEWNNDSICKAILKVGEAEGIDPHAFARSLPYLKFDQESETAILQKAVERAKGRDAAQCLVQLVSVDILLFEDVEESKRLLSAVLDNALSEIEISKFTTPQLIAALVSGACSPEISEQIFNSMSERIATIGSSQIERISYHFYHHAMAHLSVQSRTEMARRFHDFAEQACNEDAASQWRDAAFNIGRA